MIGKSIRTLVNFFFYVSLVALFIAMIFMTLDVVIRVVLGGGIIGNFEIVQILMVFIIYFALGYTQIQGKHIEVDLIKSLLPKTIEKILDTILSAFCIVAGVIMVWSSLINVQDVFRDQLETASLGIPLYPFYGVVCFGSIVLLRNRN
ncbi:MAG: TRAP transporter small permease [Gracilibacteraceae bacterium]|jgi:TRAP-type C4-dicarboxylate transport system permease small subunit|nr:TRAP transporter small permease [Gracilibacteraceae bacterium]